jgi:hypothetical protein
MRTNALATSKPQPTESKNKQSQTGSSQTIGAVTSTERGRQRLALVAAAWWCRHSRALLFANLAPV